MPKRRKIMYTAGVGATALGALGLGAGPALAAPQAGTWHINPGNGTTFTGVNSQDATLSAANVPLTCLPGTATATGTVSGDGKSSTPASLAAISSATFGTDSSPCSLVGEGVTAHLKHGTHLVGSAATATGATGYIGSTPKNASGISASINGVGDFSCHMTVTGTSVPGSYNNAGNLQIGPGGDLTIKSVTGCLGLFTSGEPAGFTAGYTVNPVISVTQS